MSLNQITMPPFPTPKLRWVNEKMVDGKLVTLYRNEQNELVIFEDGVDKKGNRMRDKKAKEKKITRDDMKKLWR